MNGSIKIEAHTHKVCEDTEEIYSDSWWSQQNLIINALDNVQARLYTDQRCVKNRVPLLESGTMGTKGHVQVIVPHITANYGATRDPPEAGIPFCTLKSFPSQIEHCIQWGRDKFNTLFSLRPQELNQLLDEAKNQELFEEKINKKNPRKKELEHSLKLIRNRPCSLNDCVRLAREKFESLFVFNVEYLITRFPVDAKNSDGTLFWALPRRMPRMLAFDSSNSTHSSFILHATALFAKAYSVNVSEGDLDPQRLALMASHVVVQRPNWKDKHIETNEQASGNQKSSDGESDIFMPEERARLTHDLAATAHSLASSNLRVFPEDFEKDDDTNHHIDFITAASNIRAAQYGIQPADRLKTKKVAGRIIPAMATSTAAITGLAALEIIKILRRAKLDSFKNAWMNLALPSVTFSEPQECSVTKISDDVSVSLWDRWDIQEGDLALGQLLNYFKKKYHVVVTAIIQNTTLIYTDALPEYKKRIPQKMSKLLNTIDGVSVYPVTMSFESLDGKDVVGPPVVLHLSKK
jgi:ubiquitin-activating enzyme E1-like protein 2